MNAAVVLAVAVLVAVSGGRAVPMPDLLGGATVQVPVVLLLPLLSAIALAAGLARGPVVEAAAARPVPLFDAAFTGALVATAVALDGLAQAVGWQGHGFAAGRNTAGYLGLALLGRRLCGPNAAALLPVACALGAGAFGSGVGDRVKPWAFPLGPSDSVPALALASAACVVGLAVGLRPRLAAEG